MSTHLNQTHNKNDGSGFESRMALMTERLALQQRQLADAEAALQAVKEGRCVRAFTYVFLSIWGAGVYCWLAGGEME